MNLATTLPTLLATAWLLPLLSFVVNLFFGPRLGKHGEKGAWVATAAIVGSCVLSVISLGQWISTPPSNSAHGESVHASGATEFGEAPGTVQREEIAKRDEGARSGEEEHHDAPPRYFSGEWYTLGQFGTLKTTIGYYIDSLTVGMFAMVTFIASLIHFYAIGYMHDELHDVEDHEVHLSNGHHLKRPGRFPRFFQYLSLFCFSMLGLVIAGNIAMVFVFWELVGICSYFLIGFYIERKSASTAANKAFIVNRVGDFGMIIGLMALWGALGTFSFGDQQNTSGAPQLTAHGEIAVPGIFSLVRKPLNHYKLETPDGMVKFSASDEVAAMTLANLPHDPAAQRALDAKIDARVPDWRNDPQHHYGYWLLIVAGLGIFCGCVGKSAQFPLHVWLPDAMEGPTPVSSLVHSATMVAAGVYLVGRFYPVFATEVLYVIAWIGAITLMLAATIAITATDIKRVLAYSTVSQLGFMMFALGIGGWVAGLFHLITHAFFKSLLFMCSGSVIHACHTNEMPKMGGLRKKMPYTAYTMLVGCLAIAGAPIVPFLFGFSGYHSKDAIIEQALAFRDANPGNVWATVLLVIPCVGAAITAFYMFRLWYMTFWGEPRDHHIYDHAHESPKVMYIPLVILAVFATAVGWKVFGLVDLLEQSQPAGLMAPQSGQLMTALTYPGAHEYHSYANPATTIALIVASAGFALATLFYGTRMLSAEKAKSTLYPLYTLFHNKWYFDELYNLIFIQPVMFIARRISDFDKRFIDGLINGLAGAVRVVAGIDDLIDRFLVDGIVNLVAGWTHSFGLALRGAQTGRLRQYVMFIVVGTVGLFVLISFFLKSTLAAP